MASLVNWAKMRVSSGGTGSITLADFNATTPSLDDKLGSGSTDISYVGLDSVAGRYERGTASFNGTTKVLSSRTVVESWSGGAYGTSAVDLTTDAIVFTAQTTSRLGDDADYGDFTVSGDGTVATVNTGAITTDMIDDDAVTGAKILDGTITTNKLAAADVITAAELQAALGVPATNGTSCDLLFSLSTIANGTYVLDPKASFPYTINSLVIDSLNNTGTVAVKIAGVDVTGLSAVSVTTTLSDTNASAANSVAVGNEVTLVFSSIATTASFVGKVRVTRG
jgi:hypothetical protein